jgi:enediyne biosynthesis protein E4
MSRSPRPFFPESSTLALAAALAVTMTLWGLAQSPQPASQAKEPMLRLVPDDLRDISWLDRLRDTQTKEIAALTAFHDFRFTDKFSASGITFRNRVVDDSGKAYKAAHYDHGTGVAIADVDGDGRLDVYFVNQVGGNQLARNLGGGRFEDITGAAGVAVAGKVSVAASFADIDNDGDADLYVTTVRAGNLLFENDGRGRFRDISAASGLNYSGHSSGAVFFDYNRDGRLDLFLVNVGRYTTDAIGGAGYQYYVAFEDAFAGHLKPEREEPNILYRNDGKNKFVDVSKQMGIQDRTWAGDASILDANDDGWPDLYVINMQGDDEYYENARGQRFVRKSRDLFPKTSWGAMGIKVFDFNNDGRMDIFITDMHSDMSDMTGPELDKVKSTMKWPESFRGTGKTSIWGNTFFRKDGPNHYREVSDAINAENYCPWGPSVGDLNADGFEDIFIASGMNYPYRYMVNTARLNDRGQRFIDAEFALGIEPRAADGPAPAGIDPRAGGVITPWFLIDASGRDTAHRDAEGLSGPVGIWGARGTRAAAIFDLDDDGDLDIITNEFGTVPMVLVSDLTDRTTVRYLAVALTGTKSNRNGLGAVVKVTAGPATYTKVMDGSSGYLSHSVAPLYFGLGAAETVDRVEVVWPSGTKQIVTSGIKLNARLDIKEQ